ncbi:hypothetical protein M440DRAFT_1060193 [Trichoderma longibrachiatum ATCC 18648]|uniref:Uncharacterized protein n=1 Tax=Trichoderma longibrachiatum ATCC 18648 TaxID=983965 RepID=A0A2T4BVK0_TRILO|nr:hypothetical protein M440DRAFT_1060193 [Trichoderma longibrachiatum ATCC 18648]
MGPRTPATTSKHALVACAGVSAPSAEPPVPVHLESHASTLNLSWREERMSRPATEALGSLHAFRVHCKSCSPLQTSMKSKCAVAVELECARRSSCFHGTPEPFRPIPSCRQRSANQCIGETDQPPCTCTSAGTYSYIPGVSSSASQAAVRLTAALPAQSRDILERQERCSADVRRS